MAYFISMNQINPFKLTNKIPSVENYLVNFLFVIKCPSQEN